MAESPINSALRQFEAAEANLTKLERLWAEIEKPIPDGLQFGSDPVYDERVRSYRDVLAGLPRIDGWKPENIPMNLNEIGQIRLDAKEVGEISAEIAVEEGIEAPGRDLAEYRHRLNKKRRQLIRNAMNDLIARIDHTVGLLGELELVGEREVNEDIKGENWEKLKSQVQEIEMLLGALFHALRGGVIFNGTWRSAWY